MTTPIIGATKISHLEDAIGALFANLPQDEVAYLDASYVPHPIVGHQYVVRNEIFAEKSHEEAHQ